MIYTGKHLNEISFPIGGIGTGSIGLAGNGSIIDWEIANRPRKGHINPFTFFAVHAKYKDGTTVTKVLQGDQRTDLSGQHFKVKFAGFGHGPLKETMCAFPHFRDVEYLVTFSAQSPFLVFEHMFEHLGRFLHYNSEFLIEILMNL